MVIKPFNDRKWLSLKSARNIHSVHSKKCINTTSALNVDLEHCK